MNKKNLFVSIFYTIWGFANLIAALFTETKLDGIFFGMAGAGIVTGLMMVYRYFYWKSPKHQQAYRERMENERIEKHDELKEKIRGMAGRYGYTLGILVTAFAMLVFAVLGSLEVAVDYRVMVLYLGCFLAFQGIAGVVIFNQLMKKYL